MVSKFVVGLALLACVGLAAQTAAVQKKSTRSTKPSSTTGRATASKGTHHASTARKSIASRPYGAPQPTTERYQQIQLALVEKGYYSGEPNGRWGADSVEALKRFQNDQNLTSDGKLNSLSLIALGLGPKRLSAQTAAAQTKAQPGGTATPTTPEPGARQ